MMMLHLPSSSHFVKILSFLIVASEWDIRQTEIDETLLKYLQFGQGCGWKVMVAGIPLSKVLKTHTHTHLRCCTVVGKSDKYS